MNEPKPPTTQDYITTLKLLAKGYESEGVPREGYRLACLAGADALEEANDSEKLRERMQNILERTANAIHGGPLENGYWSWHDLPELVEELKKK